MKKTAILALILIILSSCLFALDTSEINSFDRLQVHQYNATMDKTATALEIASMLTPAVLLGEKPDQYVKIGIMYLETQLLTWGTTELLKHTIDRARPYMYCDNPPQEKVDSGDWNNSFPSGHTAMSFAGASFASYVFWKYNPDSKWRIPVTAASYSLAATVAVLRVAGGSHFMTDVLAGALLGTAIGIGVPALHNLLADKDAAVSVSPFGLVFSMSYN